MKNIRTVAAWFLFAILCVFSMSCQDACDDLKDICKGCNADYKADCKSSLNTCEIVKGPAAKDCCESIVDTWEETCK